MSNAKQADQGSRLLKTIQAISISPEDAHALVSRYKVQARRKTPEAHEHHIQTAVARKVIGRYSKLAATTGGVTALAGVVPGIGTAVAALGGGLADATVAMKFQVDMTMCIASAFDWDLTSEDAKHLSMLVAVAGSLEKFGGEAATALASKAGVAMIRQYLKGAALTAVKTMLKRVGITFTRKAFEKAAPFGIGVVIGSSANYALTRYVGHSAMNWFIIDRDLRSSPQAGATEDVTAKANEDVAGQQEQFRTAAPRSSHSGKPARQSNAKRKSAATRKSIQAKKSAPAKPKIGSMRKSTLGKKAPPLKRKSRRTIQHSQP